MRAKRFARILVVTLAAIGSIAVTSFSAGVPNTLNYQGTLTDSTGKPVTAAAKPVTFKLYTTAMGGTPFWTESQSVPVNNGQFSAVLGNTVSLPTDKFTGITYIGVAIDSGPEMLPRQKMTSVAYALKAADAIPKGVIVMWSGAVNQIPEGWALCDGVPRTLSDGSTVTPPNLKDRFVLGAGGTYAVASIGGASTVDINHTHNDDHNHSGNTDNWINDDSKVQDGNEDYVADAPHYHSFTTNYKSQQGHGSTTQWMNQNNIVDKMPPYYALAFIMKL